MPGVIRKDEWGTTTATGDGVVAFQCLTMASGIKLWRMHRIKCHRMFKISEALRTAATLTRKPLYPRSLDGMLQAEKDLKWRAEFIRKNLLD